MEYFKLYVIKICNAQENDSARFPLSPPSTGGPWNRYLGGPTYWTPVVLTDDGSSSSSLWVQPSTSLTVTKGKTSHYSGGTSFPCLDEGERDRTLATDGHYHRSPGGETRSFYRVPCRHVSRSTGDLILQEILVDSPLGYNLYDSSLRPHRLSHPSVVDRLTWEGTLGVPQDPSGRPTFRMRNFKN